MPVLVVGADTPLGRAAVAALSDRAGEIRAFVSDPAVAGDLRARGVKVALGDVSDGSHVGGAALNCFSVVFITDAADDERERSFASSVEEVFAQWAEAVGDAPPSRIIWVEHAVPAPDLPHLAIVERGSIESMAARIVELDELAELPDEGMRISE